MNATSITHDFFYQKNKIKPECAVNTTYSGLLFFKFSPLLLVPFLRWMQFCLADHQSL